MNRERSSFSLLEVGTFNGLYSLELAARRLTVVEGMHFPKVAANALLTLDPEGRGAGAVAVVVDRAGEEIAPCDATALVSIRVLPVAGAPELPGGTKVPRGWLREPPRLSQATAADGARWPDQGTAAGGVAPNLTVVGALKLSLALQRLVKVG